MKKFIVTSILFAFFASFIYVIAIGVAGNFSSSSITPNNIKYIKGNGGHMYSRLQEADSVHDVDVLFLGSSHAYRGFDTRLFDSAGISSFNLASSSQTPLQTRLLLERYLDKIQPNMVIYEVYPGIFELDGVESSLDIISNGKTDFSWLKLAFSQNHVKVYNTFIYATYKNLFEDETFNESTSKNGNTYIPGGYVQRELSYYKHSQVLPTKEWKLRKDQFKAFEDNLELIRSKNIPVLLIQSPITSALYQSYNNNKEFDDRMRRYGTYHNLNTKIALDDSLHFYDEHHLNQKGVEIFDAYLIKTFLK